METKIQKENSMSAETIYGYLVLVHGKTFTDNVLEHLDNRTNPTVYAPKKIIESMRDIVDYYNEVNETNYQVSEYPVMTHTVYEDENNTFTHRKKEQ